MHPYVILVIAAYALFMGGLAFGSFQSWRR